MATWEPSKYIKSDFCTIESFVFPGGETNVRVKNVFLNDHTNKITAYLVNAAAREEFYLLLSALHHEYVPLQDIHVSIPYFPFSRQDRVCNKGECASLEAFTCQLNFLKVSVMDAHSSVTPALLGRCHNMHPYEILTMAYSNHQFDSSNYDLIIAPDTGAENRARKVSYGFGKQIMCLTKDRDIKTGEIRGVTVPRVLEPTPAGGYTFDSLWLTNPPRALIVDDICDGGRTFVEAAKALYNNGFTDLSLYVTHGIFSNGFEELLKWFKVIYYTNSRGQDLSLPPEHLFRVSQ